ncbi:hypothetical protein [Novosphingobium sp. Gsoil 351]|uniref:hypothetical protein n=1 Tax=Novosphingobium sp. Gsoil 351 TaxID=2675225 RepID=UPI0012B45C6C|nr:hypothetical protein [Novosphingobium sp. Gsoil 351]QGN53969.1 hypothetical protein GKE62_04855 [Novosphingobium sp. Gsoil 351]
MNIPSPAHTFAIEGQIARQQEQLEARRVSGAILAPSRRDLDHMSFGLAASIAAHQRSAQSFERARPITRLPLER